MLRNLIRVGVILLVAHALYRFVPVYVHYYQFQDAVKETAMFARDRVESDLVDRVMTLAERYDIPLQREAVQVTKDKENTYIVVSYEEQIEWLPKYKRTMPFSVSVEGWHVKPPTASDALGK